MVLEKSFESAEFIPTARIFKLFEYSVMIIILCSEIHTQPLFYSAVETAIINNCPAYLDYCVLLSVDTKFSF